MKIPIGDMMAAQTLQVKFIVTGIRLAKFRMWLGAKIIHLGARVVGCGIEIKP